MGLECSQHLRGELSGAEVDQALLGADDVNSLVVWFEGEGPPAGCRENISLFFSRKNSHISLSLTSELSLLYFVSGERLVVPDHHVVC